MNAADIDAAVEIFASAFQDSSLYRYFEPDAEKRGALLRLAFRHRVSNGFDTRDNILAAIDEDLAGAALWARPAPPLPPNEALTEAVRRYNPAVFEKWRHFHSILFEALDQVYAAPHWALAPIAVLPEFQGRGVAHKLIAAKLAEITPSGIPCMLATQDEVNIPRYQRYGFRQVHTVQISGGLHSYVMLWQPDALP
jgi:GNAT superfamily N-acetyltransferase